MNFPQQSMRHGTKAADNMKTGVESATKDAVQSPRNLPGGDGLFAYTSSYGTAAERRVSAPSISSTDRRTNEKSRNDRRERTRLLIASTLTVLYIAFAGLMLSASTGHPSTGVMAKRQADGQLVISWVVPAGMAYDAGIRPGSTILNTKEVLAQTGAAEGEEIDLTQAQKLDVLQNNKTITVYDDQKSDNNQYKRWGYALLGFIFMFVGGPVFAKARQRTAAVSFYIFCMATAVALAVAMVSYLLYGWALALQFTTMPLVAASFAYFFFQFPVPAVKTREQNIALISVLGGGALLILLGYLWVIATSPSNYSPVQMVSNIFLALCGGIGMVRLISSFIGERSAEVRRQRILLVIGTVLAFGPSLFLGLLPALIIGHPIINIYTTAFTVAFLPLFFAYAITQHQLLGISGFVRRSVVYLIMGFTVLSAFFLIAAAASAVLPKGWAGEEGSILGFGIFVFLIAVSFGYVQRRVEWLVDRFIYHDAYDYKQALLEFSTQLAAEQDLNILTHELVERTCRMMNLDCGTLVLAVHPGEVSAMVAHGTPAAGQTASLDNGLAEGGSLSTNPIMVAVHAPSKWVARSKETLPHVQEQADDPYLLAYAHYGECSDWLPQSLEVELTRQGMDLRHTGAPTEFFSFYAGPAYQSGQLDTSNLGRRRNDPEDTLRHRLTGTRNTSSTAPRPFLGVPLWTRQRFVGILCFGTKKTGERFGKDDLSLLNTLGVQAALAIYNAQLYEMREQALLDTITALAHAIEAKDTYTLNHCERITGRAVALAQSLGLPQTEVENIRLGSILHDVGKIGIPDAILNKPARLTDEEYERIKEHAVIGARIVQSVSALQGVVPIVRHHQERFDGTGYPDGLREQGIPIGARIIAVVDAYGAMTEDRVYRKAPGHKIALSEINRFAGKQFDPVIAEAFIRLLEAQPDLGEE